MEVEAKVNDLSDAELDALEAKLGPRPRIATMWCCLTPDETDEVKQVIAEVRRWRDKVADEAGLARLAAKTNQYGMTWGEFWYRAQRAGVPVEDARYEWNRRQEWMSQAYGYTTPVKPPEEVIE